MAISMSVSGEASVIDDTLLGGSLEFSSWLRKNSELSNRVSPYTSVADGRMPNGELANSGVAQTDETLDLIRLAAASRFRRRSTGRGRAGVLSSTGGSRHRGLRHRQQPPEIAIQWSGLAARWLMT